MSYTRHYSEIVSKTISVSYPKSDSGGSQSVTVDIPVDVNIHVDTNPFDNSVSHIKGKVDLLTDSIVATETAEIASKAKNAEKVGDTIVNGFFSYIRSEISQQVAELTQRIDAHLMHLRELVQSCAGKKKQMQADYNRIAGRYIKIFDDLNNELSNRIFEMDKPAFVFKQETDNQKRRTTSNDLINTVAILGTENHDLQSKIGTSIAKKRAFDTINKMTVFLWQQKKLKMTIQQSMLNDNWQGSIYMPCCFVESNTAKDQNDKNIYCTDYLSVLNDKSIKNKITEQFSSNNLSWGKPSTETQKNLGIYFNSELNNSLPGQDQHAVRVREMIRKIAIISSINVIDFQQI